MASRARYGIGRAIAASQTEAKKCIIYRHLDTPVLFINPRPSFPKQDMVDVLDDRMSFSDLPVRVRRYKRCIICCKGLGWNDCSTKLEGDISGLIQHEYDHLDGILAALRAVDERALMMKSRWWIVQGGCEDTQTF